MRFPDLLAMSLNNLKRRKLRTALTVLGVIIGTASIVVMLSLGIGLSEMNRELIESYGSLTAIQVHADTSSSMDDKSQPNYLTDDVVRSFTRMEHVTTVYPLLEVYVMMQQGQYQASTSLIGAPREYLENIPLGEGQLPPPSDNNLQLIVGNRIIQWFSNMKTGKGYWDTNELPPVDFMNKPLFVIFDTDAYYQSQGTESEVSPPKKYLLETAAMVEGTPEEFNDYSYSVYTDLELLKTQLRKIFKKKVIPGQPTNRKGKPYNYFVYNQAIVNVDNMENVQEVQTALNDMGFQAYSNIDWMEQTQQQSSMIQAVLGGIGAVSLFVAAIGIANTMMMSIYERTKEIGIIKVLGCDMKVIRNMFLLESGFIGFMGGVVGVALSYTISLCMNQFLNLAEQLVGVEGNLSQIPLWLALAAIGFAVVVGMAAGFFPSLRAMRLSPLAAIRNE